MTILYILRVPRKMKALSRVFYTETRVVIDQNVSRILSHLKGLTFLHNEAYLQT